MKFLVYTFLLISLINCTTQTNVQNEKKENSLSFDKNEEDEYDIVVFDSQYDIFLNTIARPMNHYSEAYYKNKNQIFVNEWNYRHSQPFHYDPNLYAVRIDYNPQVDYGIRLEYKLYNFFKFIEWKYKVNLGFGR